MRKLIWVFILPLLMWCLLISSVRADVVRNDNMDFGDTITWNRSVQKSNVSIIGIYPVGGRQPLLDSVRLWIAMNLSDNNVFSLDPLFSIDSALLSDGRRLVDLAGTRMMDVTLEDDDVMSDSSFMGYGQEFSFGPLYESDSLLTYSFSGSTFIHFSATYLEEAKTFNRNNGVGLTYANCFIPDSLERLIELIKDGLSTQHFKLDIAIEGEPTRTLQDVLYDADNLPLPASAPEFCAEGIKFSYQNYEIASFAMGMPSCILPYETVKSMLTPEVRRLIPIN